MMNEKKQRRIVLIGVLLLTGLFALGYIGINRVAFAGSGIAAILGVQDNQQDEEDDHYITQDDAESDASEEYTVPPEYVYLIPLQDHYIKLDEAEVIFTEVLYEKTGIEFDTSDFSMILLEDPEELFSIWLGFLLQDDKNGEDHQIRINAETGEVLEFITIRIPIEGDTPDTATITITISGSFYIEDLTADVPSHWGTEIKPYHLSIEEAAEVVAGVVYEEFDTTLDGHTIYLNFNDNPHHDGEYWQGWVVLEEDMNIDEIDKINDDFEVFIVETQVDFGVYFLINARTGEVTNTPIWQSRSTSKSYG